MTEGLGSQNTEESSPSLEGIYIIIDCVLALVIVLLALVIVLLALIMDIYYINWQKKNNVSPGQTDEILEMDVMHLATSNNHAQQELPEPLNIDALGVNAMGMDRMVMFQVAACKDRHQL